MTATVARSCPNGCVEISVSGEHATRPDLEHVEDVALPEEYDRVRNRTCPACGRLMELDVEEANGV